jgi:hypothetical protein
MGGCFGEGRWTLQRRARVSSIVDMVLAGIGITTSGVDLEYLMVIQDDITKSQLERDDGERLKLIYKMICSTLMDVTRPLLKLTAMKTVYMICIVLAINVIKLVMGYTLWNGVRERDHSKCRSWLVVSIVLWIIQLASFVVKLAIGAFVLTSTISTGLALLGRIFAMKAVNTFVGELVREREKGFIEA